MSTDLEIERLKEDLKIAKDQKNRAIDLLVRKEKEDKLKPSANFVQMDRKSMKSLRELADASPTQFKMLMIMAERMDKSNAIMISNKALQSLLNLSRQYVSKNINELAKNKWIKIMKVGTANAYFLNSNVFWTDRLEKQKYAEFKATIITTEDEQEVTAEEWDSIEVKKIPILNSKDERIMLDKEELPLPDQQDLDLN